jgi:hypothetical protein
MDEYQHDVADLARQDPTLAAQVRGFNTLENVLAWMPQHGLHVSSLDVIPQDEFSLDLLLPLDAAGRHLVFGIT